MDKNVLDTVQQLVVEVGGSHSSTMYGDFWGIERTFNRLPVITREVLFGCPLSQRRYKTTRSLVKIVKNGKMTFVSEWAYEDVAREHYGVESKRPMVYLSYNAESIEKSLWCYERGMVPLIGELHNKAVAVAMAAKYQIDSLITDAQSLSKIEPYLASLSSPLASISILGDSFDVERLTSLARYARQVRLVLSLPETGVIAEAFVTPNPIFRPLPDCILESINGSLVVTKLPMLVTPIIRYETCIRSHVLSMELS